MFDCSSVAPNLFESDLFGHVRGAFTGAAADKVGWFEKCDGGSLLIDEIGELPPNLQLRLLRLIGRKEYSRMGEAELRRADVRIIAATNRNLHQMVCEGTFREDLYFRLAEARVTLPPLRQRVGDAVLLAERAVAAVSARCGRPLKLDEQSRRLVASYQWPGNIRQLVNVVRRAAHFADGPDVSIPKAEQAPSTDQTRELLPYDEMHLELDRTYLREVMDLCDWKIRKAARFLGITRERLKKRLREAGIKYRDQSGSEVDPSG